MKPIIKKSSDHDILNPSKIEYISNLRFMHIFIINWALNILDWLDEIPFQMTDAIFISKISFNCYLEGRKACYPHLVWLGSTSSSLRNISVVFSPLMKILKGIPL